MTSNIIMLILGIILVIIAIALFKKISRIVFFILMLGGAYSFSKGLIDLGTVLQWWSSFKFF